MKILGRAGNRVRWEELCQDSDFRGRWVALEAVSYDAGMPVEGAVVDSDDDLAALCARIQAADNPTCAILFCDDKSSGIRRAVDGS